MGQPAHGKAILQLISFWYTWFKSGTLLVQVKARANGFNICFNISSILLNAVERLLNDVERRDGKRFQHLIQQNFASGLVVSSRL